MKYFRQLVVILVPVLTIIGGTFLQSDTKDLTGVNYYPEHLDGNYTGIINGKTCHDCHFDYEMNNPEGKLTVNGIPDKVSAEQTYEISIEIRRPDLGAGGFQLSSAFNNGKQAGQFLIENETELMFTEISQGSLQLLQHTAQSTSPDTENLIRWEFSWKAPSGLNQEEIIFRVSANAGNGDQSEFGDWIYNSTIQTRF